LNCALLVIADKDEAEQLINRVGEALSLLNDYNARLAAEMEDRKKLKSMLHDFLHAQKELLLQAEKRHLVRFFNGQNFEFFTFRACLRST
jgi:regulator of Ty1 transposition protein 103